MKNMILRIAVAAVLVLALALSYGASFSDTAYAGPPEGKGGQDKEKGGQNLFWD